jgi:hypothetical protein
MFPFPEGQVPLSQVDMLGDELRRASQRKNEQRLSWIKEGTVSRKEEDFTALGDSHGVFFCKQNTVVT